MKDVDNFDWGELPYEWWINTGKSIGATEQQCRFAASKFRGSSNALAAREAGYGTGSSEAERTEGYRVSRSNKVMQLLSLAAGEAGGGPDGTITKDEARRILSALGRGSDPQVRIKALEALQKMDERDEAAKEREGDNDPRTTAIEIIKKTGAPLAALLIAATFAGGDSPGYWIPPVCKLAPFLKRRLPELHAKFRAAYLLRAKGFPNNQEEQQSLRDFDAWSDAPECSDAELIAAFESWRGR